MGTTASVDKKPIVQYKTKTQNVHGIPKILSDPYIMNASSIGEGRFGYVRSGVDMKCERKIAVKCVLKKFSQETQTLYNEKQILETLCHPNIVKFYDFFTTPTETCMVLEKCDGGELFDLIEKEHKPLSEKRACVYLVQILEALEYLHSKNIAHRDLKLENCMFKDKSQNIIKIIDFGMAVVINEPISGVVGTVSYMSPDIIRGYYTCKTDMWSVGVMLYIMISDEFPFEGKTDNEVTEKIKNCKYTMDSPVWSKVSSSCKSLIRQLMDPNPTTRLSAKNALNHPWILNTCKLNQYLPWRTVLYGLDKYTKYNIFKRLILQRMVSYLDGSLISKITNTYNMLVNKEENLVHILSADSLSSLCSLEGETIPIDKIETALDFIQSQMKEPITYELFAASCLRRTEYMNDTLLYKVFLDIDKDKDGSLNNEDLNGLVKNTHDIDIIMNDIQMLSSQTLLSYNKSTTSISYNMYKKLIGARTFKELSIHTVKSSLIHPESSKENQQLKLDLSSPPDISSSDFEITPSLTDLDLYNFTSPAVEACLNTPTPTEDYEDEIIFM